MMRAVARGYVAEASAHFVRRGLLRGFDLSVDVSSLRRKMNFRNYRSVLSNRAAVSKALRKRLHSGKTICLGTYERGNSHLLPWNTFRVFPMGAVEKPLEPGEVRVTSDHTRSGVNAATQLGELAHSITSYDDVIRFLEKGCNLRVSDVEGAFPLLPLAPEVWAFLCVTGGISMIEMMHVPPLGSCTCTGVPILGLRERREPGIGFSSRSCWGWRRRRMSSPSPWPCTLTIWA
eukprot:2154371-Pleurochrysis_carterae.AAC.1